MAQDRIYSMPLGRVGDFEFDDAVADVFPDMIRRSVPGYGSMLSMIAQTAERYAQPESHLYDLGCSLGAGTLLLLDHARPDCRIVAVDNSPAMISRLRQRMAGCQTQNSRVSIVQADIRDVQLSRASVVVLNLTLQFLPPADRTELMQKIADGMLPGGAVILSEKICFADPDQQQLMTELHHDFKRAHGYSDLEIAQKRTAIENRLVPETLEAHVARLRGAGFRSVAVWFQCFNFASILAIR
ncbi:MAG: carboxy-S-adenosyl-L-methionine synthase CmoA [Fuerstiella sp.]